MSSGVTISILFYKIRRPPKKKKYLGVKVIENFNSLIED